MTSKTQYWTCIICYVSDRNKPAKRCEAHDANLCKICARSNLGPSDAWCRYCSRTALHDGYFHILPWIGKRVGGSTHVTMCVIGYGDDQSRTALAAEISSWSQMPVRMIGFDNKQLISPFASRMYLTRRVRKICTQNGENVEKVMTRFSLWSVRHRLGDLRN